jgi:anti-sigma regulatory factor (Ser/Thr protein kinase)
VLSNLRAHPRDIVHHTQKEFGLSRPAVLNYIHRLLAEKKIEVSGSTKDREYALLPISSAKKTYLISDHLAEDKVWHDDVNPVLKDIKENVFRICRYGFTEIFNNAIDHSGGTEISILIIHYPDQIEMIISDNGIGIFKKIQRELNLDDTLHSILELCKGKLTTDPRHHTGEGIFFTSRMFDMFLIFSSHYSFMYSNVEVIYEDKNEDFNGTSVVMKIAIGTTKTTQNIFRKFVGDIDEGFKKTIVPVKLAGYKNESLISRSQAKRLLARFEKFSEVILDFKDVTEIGRAFADEIFRVFVGSHPIIKITAVNTNKKIDRLIQGVKNQPMFP